MHTVIDEHQGSPRRGADIRLQRNAAQFLGNPSYDAKKVLESYKIARQPDPILSRRHFLPLPEKADRTERQKQWLDAEAIFKEPTPDRESEQELPLDGSIIDSSSSHSSKGSKKSSETTSPEGKKKKKKKKKKGEDDSSNKSVTSDNADENTKKKRGKNKKKGASDSVDDETKKKKKKKKKKKGPGSNSSKNSKPSEAEDNSTYASSDAEEDGLQEGMILAVPKYPDEDSLAVKLPPEDESWRCRRCEATWRVAYKMNPRPEGVPQRDSEGLAVMDYCTSCGIRKRVLKSVGNLDDPILANLRRRRPPPGGILRLDDPDLIYNNNVTEGEPYGEGSQDSDDTHDSDDVADPFDIRHPLSRKLLKKRSGVPLNPTGGPFRTKYQYFFGGMPGRLMTSGDNVSHTEYSAAGPEHTEIFYYGLVDIGDNREFMTGNEGNIHYAEEFRDMLSNIFRPGAVESLWGDNVSHDSHYEHDYEGSSFFSHPKSSM